MLYLMQKTPSNSNVRHILILIFIFFLFGCVSDSAIGRSKCERAIIALSNNSELRDECVWIELEYESDHNPVYFPVRELHNAECGGDPNTSPSVYFVGLDRVHHRLFLSDPIAPDDEKLLCKINTSMSTECRNVANSCIELMQHYFD